jgi:hypothetical protein
MQIELLSTRIPTDSGLRDANPGFWLREDETGQDFQRTLQILWTAGSADACEGVNL